LNGDDHILGSAKLLDQYLRTVQILQIPVYQRNYEWKEQQCKQLFDDLVKVVRNNRKTHFFGSLVSVSDGLGGVGEYLIIDGQQRITTVSILLLAMVNLLREGHLTSSHAQLVKMIEDFYLSNPFEPEDRKIRLKPVKGDSDAYIRLWGAPEDYDLASNVTANYNYFYNRILNNQDGISIDDLLAAIRKLLIIDISLTHEDDPQLIFESLNSTGLDLSEGDKIRNYILMGQTARQQERFYEAYWEPIEHLTVDWQNKKDVSSLFATS